MEPHDSWVAKWNRLARCCPGVYAKALKELPHSAVDSDDGLIDDDTADFIAA